MWLLVLRATEGIYASLVSAESRHARIAHIVAAAGRWRPRSNRQVWLVVSALAIAICAEAIAVPAKRDGLACTAAGLIIMGLWATGRLRQSRERQALTARLAAVPREDIPADVIGLIRSGKKIHAIKRYRELTGAGLQEAKAVIDSL
jgi:ribosomal protein L7/L12